MNKNRLTAPEWIGLAAILAWPVIAILVTQIPIFRCHPGHTAGTNARAACPHAAAR